MATAAALRAQVFDGFQTVVGRRQLSAAGIDAHDIDAQVQARRWQRIGPAVVLHNAGPTKDEWREVCLINCGPRAVLTSFTAAEVWGLEGWTRDAIHVLAPAGTADPGLRGLRLHRVGDWTRADVVPPRRLHRLAPALVLAASTFARSRPGCGLLAAAVQQRLLTAAELRAALHEASRTRHRRALLLAMGDVEQGAEALSEIDFGRLCARYRLPLPTRQAIRRGANGRRRYLDVEWRLPDGRVVAVEVDGAHHMSARQWSADQLRQNEIVIDGTIVLRYPAVVVRDEPDLVAAQLRRVIYGDLDGWVQP